MSILRIDFNIDLNNNFAEDDHDTIILTRLLARDIKFNQKKRSTKKIIEESMPVVWHPGRWWNFYMLEDEKKETEPTFTE